MDPIVVGIIILAVMAIGGALYMRVLYRSVKRLYASHDDEVPVKMHWAILASSFALVAPPLFFMGFLITLLIG